MVVVRQDLNECLTRALGQPLPEPELVFCLQHIEILEPSTGKLIWQAADAATGLYIVLAGKVRVLDAMDHLVVSLPEGASFGELTLFADERFQIYSVRASQDVKVGFLNLECVEALWQAFPAIQTHLYEQAIVRDLLLLSRQIAVLQDVPRPQLLLLLSLLEVQWLEVGSLPFSPGTTQDDDKHDHNKHDRDDQEDQNWANNSDNHLENDLENHPWNDRPFWLIRQGELRHVSGLQLTAGQIYAIDTLPTSGWQVTQSTHLFYLKSTDLETVLLYIPQLQAFTSPSRGSQSAAIQPIATAAVEALIDRSMFAHASIHSPTHPPTHSSPPSPTPPSSVALRPAVPPQSTTERQSHRQSSDRSVAQSVAAAAVTPQHTQISRAYFPKPSVKVKHWWRQATNRYPFYRQQSATDCGVACLVMIGQYWGKRLSLNQLRNMANVDRRGVSLRGLVAAAESIGFAARPVKATLEGLAQQRLPAIVHWQGKHFVVVYRVTRRSVIVADPAIGQKTFNHSDFLSHWTGYTLLLQPTVTLRKTEDAQPNFWQFFEIIKPHRLILLEVLIASLLIQVFGLFTPLFTQLLLDRVVVQRSGTTLVAVGSGLLIFSLFSIAMTSLRRYLIYHTSNRIDLSLTVGFITHAFRLPLQYFDTRHVGDITSRVQENRTIRRFLSGDALITLLDVLTMFIYLGLMFWYNVPMAAMTVALIPVLGLLTLVATPFLQRVSREIFNAKTIEGSYLIEALNGVSTIKAMGIERTVRWQWEDFFHQFIKTNFSGQLLNERLSLLTSLIETTAVKGLFLFGVWQVIQEQLTIGQLIAFNMLLGNVINPVQRLIRLWHNFQEVLIAMERINDVVAAAPEEDGQTLILPALPPIQGRIRFEQVTFRYSLESDKNTLENICFDVQPGQTIALVGRSGSGKTTIAKLLLGLYPPTTGRILIDGYDINLMAKRSLRQQVGVVDQDTFLFSGTVRENIAIAYPNAALSAIKTAAKLAGADRFIEELPMKYDTQIGEGGGMLSGGQRQRLAIARALLGNPRLLILDEATSSLDAESEHIIQTNLNSIRSDRTTFIIAHRLSTVRNADLILVLDRGVLIECGNHDELMTRRGQYFYLNQQQLAIAS